MDSPKHFSLFTATDLFCDETYETPSPQQVNRHDIIRPLVIQENRFRRDLANYMIASDNQLWGPSGFDLDRDAYEVEQVDGNISQQPDMPILAKLTSKFAVKLMPSYESCLDDFQHSFVDLRCTDEVDFDLLFGKKGSQPREVKIKTYLKVKRNLLGKLIK
jgi:hypothetical protein